MPTVNTYFQEDRHLPQLEAITSPLKLLVAKELTCGDRTLNPDEISVRLLQSLGSGMIADIEMDIVAAPYAERIERQDEICRNVADFVMASVKDVKDIKVWISLNELGHSWE